MADCNPTDGHTPACAARSASMDSHRSCSKAPNLRPRALDYLPRCPGGCGKPIEEDGELCRGCLLGANIVNRNAIANLKGELDAVRGTRPALRLFPGETTAAHCGSAERVTRLVAAVRNWLPAECQVNNVESLQVAMAALKELEGVARELHAVRVLDAWAKKTGTQWLCGPHVFEPDAFSCSVLRKYSGSDRYRGATPAEARAAAAKALLEEDPTLGTEA